MGRIVRFLLSRSIRLKLNLLFLLILVPSFIFMGYRQAATSTELLKGEALEKAQSDLQTGFALVDKMYPGHWAARDGQLYKGDTAMNDNFEFVDWVGQLTNGDTATLFLGDTRVATNVEVEGKRATGTKASDVVIDKVLKQGEVFLGQANVVGHTYQAAYMPIKDADGAIIGMWYVGAPDASERIQQIKQDTIMDMLVEVAITLVIALVLNLIFTRSIIRRIQASANYVRVIASGDLTSADMPVKSRDETGTLALSLNQMASQLRRIIGQVQDTSAQVASFSAQLTASAEQTSGATEHITTAIQEVAVGSERQVARFAEAGRAAAHISGGMDQTVQLIAEVSASSNAGSESARAGNETVTQTFEQMNLMQRTVEDAAGIVHELEEKSKAIGKIVTVITGIAYQTNLLALNAGIEAARAGEHGKGFAVVAAEVRKLAEQSGAAAEEIRDLIGEVQNQANQAVVAMSQGTEAVQTGIHYVHQSGSTFREIVGAIEAVSLKSREVTAIVDQVNRNAHGLVRTMQEVAGISEQASANAQNVAAAAEEQNAYMEEVASSAEYLGTLAEELRSVAGQFKVS